MDAQVLAYVRRHRHEALGKEAESTQFLHGHDFPNEFRLCGHELSHAQRELEHSLPWKKPADPGERKRISNWKQGQLPDATKFP
jgi:hypothetical protein